MAFRKFCSRRRSDPHKIWVKRKAADKKVSCFYGAGDEARTRYLHLGKVALYRMSYTRISCGTVLIIADSPRMSRHYHQFL